MTAMSTGSRVPISMLREMKKPLYPLGMSLDAKMVFNFRLKVKRMPAKGLTATDIAWVHNHHGGRGARACF